MPGLASAYPTAPCCSPEPPVQQTPHCCAHPLVPSVCGDSCTEEEIVTAGHLVFLASNGIKWCIFFGKEYYLNIYFTIINPHYKNNKSLQGTLKIQKRIWRKRGGYPRPHLPEVTTVGIVVCFLPAPCCLDMCLFCFIKLGS